MGIQYFDSEQEMDDAFEATMENIQEERRIRYAIEQAEQRVEDALDELQCAEEELKELQEQLEELSV
jgi:outer membrane protein TolC